MWCRSSNLVFVLNHHWTTHTCSSLQAVVSNCILKVFPLLCVGCMQLLVGVIYSSRTKWGLGGTTGWFVTQKYAYVYVCIGKWKCRIFYIWIEVCIVVFMYIVCMYRFQRMLICWFSRPVPLYMYLKIHFTRARHQTYFDPDSLLHQGKKSYVIITTCFALCRICIVVLCCPLLKRPINSYCA